jgi:hypothetical protein
MSAKIEMAGYNATTFDTTANRAAFKQMVFLTYKRAGVKAATDVSITSIEDTSTPAADSVCVSVTIAVEDSSVVEALKTALTASDQSAFVSNAQKQGLKKVTGASTSKKSVASHVLGTVAGEDVPAHLKHQKKHKEADFFSHGRTHHGGEEPRLDDDYADVLAGVVRNRYGEIEDHASVLQAALGDKYSELVADIEAAKLDEHHANTLTLALRGSDAVDTTMADVLRTAIVCFSFF